MSRESCNTKRRRIKNGKYDHLWYDIPIDCWYHIMKCIDSQRDYLSIVKTMRVWINLKETKPLHEVLRERNMSYYTTNIKFIPFSLPINDQNHIGTIMEKIRYQNSEVLPTVIQKLGKFKNLINLYLSFSVDKIPPFSQTWGEGTKKKYNFVTIKSKDEPSFSSSLLFLNLSFSNTRSVEIECPFSRVVELEVGGGNNLAVDWSQSFPNLESLMIKSFDVTYFNLKNQIRRITLENSCSVNWNTFENYPLLRYLHLKGDNSKQVEKFENLPELRYLGLMGKNELMMDPFADGYNSMSFSLSDYTHEDKKINCRSIESLTNLVRIKINFGRFGQKVKTLQEELEQNVVFRVRNLPKLEEISVIGLRERVEISETPNLRIVLFSNCRAVEIPFPFQDATRIEKMIFVDSTMGSNLFHSILSMKNTLKVLKLRESKRSNIEAEIPPSDPAITFEGFKKLEEIEYRPKYEKKEGMTECFQDCPNLKKVNIFPSECFHFINCSPSKIKVSLLSKEMNSFFRSINTSSISSLSLLPIFGGVGDYSLDLSFDYESGSGVNDFQIGIFDRSFIFDGRNHSILRYFCVKILDFKSNSLNLNEIVLKNHPHLKYVEWEANSRNRIMIKGCNSLKTVIIRGGRSTGGSKYLESSKVNELYRIVHLENLPFCRKLVLGDGYGSISHLFIQNCGIKTLEVLGNFRSWEKKECKFAVDSAVFPLLEEIIMKGKSPYIHNIRNSENLPWSLKRIFLPRDCDGMIGEISGVDRNAITVCLGSSTRKEMTLREFFQGAFERRLGKYHSSW